MPGQAETKSVVVAHGSSAMVRRPHQRSLHELNTQAVDLSPADFAGHEPVVSELEIEAAWG